jgi:hypothetical protein
MGRKSFGGLRGGQSLGGVSATSGDDTTLSAKENKNITINTEGTGIVSIDGNQQIMDSQELRFGDADNSNYVSFKAPTTVASNVTWTLPSVDASVADQALVSNSTGTLSFATTFASLTDNDTDASANYLYFGTETSGKLLNPRVNTAKLKYTPSTGEIESPKLKSTGTLTAAGVTTITDATASSTTATGALVVTGGVGVGGSLYANAFYGDGAGITNIPARGRLLSVNVYTTQNGQWNSVSSAGTSATWSRPAGCTNVLVYVTGGGGGCRHNNNDYRGAGGGGGATAIKWLDVTNTSSVSVTVGGGGTHNYGGRGNTGGTSTFGPFVTCTGGQGGITDNPYEGGPGGDASGGDINLPGGGGEMSHGSNREGGGGMSFWFKAGSHHMNQNSNIEILHGQWGSGGSFGYYSSVNAGYGNGGGGAIIVYNYS